MNEAVGSTTIASATVGAGLFSSPWRHRELLVALVKREVLGRYRGSAMGMLWSLLNPIFMLVVYTFVFGLVFKTRWPGGSGSRSEFVLLLFAGLLVFNVFSECVLRAPRLIVDNANYVKKVVFPLEILPWVTLGGVLFHLLASVSVWMVFHLVLVGAPHLTAVLLPLVLLPLILVTLGVSWTLAALGTYLRDIQQMVGVFVSALMFLSAIFYPVTALPENYQALLRLNPLTLVVEQARDVLFWGVVPDIATWSIGLAGSMVIAWLGFAWFQKARNGFADVL